MTPATLCPSWCTQPAGDHDCATRNGLPVHYGPDFGPSASVGVQKVDGEQFEAVVWFDKQASDAVFYTGPDELRRAAAEARRTAAAMLEAADWMEAHR